MEERRLLQSKDIRTMKKDIARFQEEKEAKLPPVSVPAVPSVLLPAKAVIKEEEEENRIKLEELGKEKPTEKEFLKPEKEELDIDIVKIEEEIQRKKEETGRQREEEEKKKKEERERIKKRQGPEEQKNLLLEEKEALKKEKEKINEEIKKLSVEKSPFDVKRQALLEEIEVLQESFDIIAKKEERVEKKELEIEKKEFLAKTAEGRRELEKERWEIEKERREIEKNRWPWDEKLKSAEDRIKEIDSQCRETDEKEKGLKEKERGLIKRENEIQLETEMIDLKEKLRKLELIKKQTGEGKAKYDKELERIKQRLDRVIKEERSVEEDKKLIEGEEKITTDFGRRRGLEEERWQAEEKRRKIESERWGLEKEKERIEIHQKRESKKIQEILDREAELIKKIREIEKKLGIEKIVVFEKPKQGPEIKPAVKTEIKEPIQEIKAVPEEEKRRSEIEQAKKRIESLKEARKGAVLTHPTAEVEVETEAEAEEESAVSSKIKEESERKEELTKEEKRREELLIRLQEAQKTQEEKEKPRPPVSSLNPKPDFRSFQPEGKEQDKQKEETYYSAPFPKIPKKPSFGEKLWVRILVFILVLGVLSISATFWYWYLVIRKQAPFLTEECKIDTDCPEGKICSQEGICLAEEEKGKCENDSDCPEGNVCKEGLCLEGSSTIVIPASLFEVDSVKNLSVSSLDEVYNLLGSVFQETQELETFKRIIISNIEENKVIGLKDFFSALGIKVAAEFYKKAEDDFTLFILSQPEGSRLGFVVKVKEESGLSDLFRLRESFIKDDFKKFFELMGAAGSPLSPYFKNGSTVLGYSGPNFRYQTLAKNDLGICYAIYNDYFIFTSSWKSMTGMIIRLMPKRLDFDLKYGDRGKEVGLLQSWLAKDPVVYPEGKISGYFDGATEKAVIRFQEKYSVNILDPQGLYQGNGIVDLYTRNKLNGLYGE